MSNAIQPIRVTISQAANLFGISQKTIRRAIQTQEVLYIVVRGVYKINFESLLRWSQSRTKINNKLQSKGIGQYVGKWKIKNRLFSPNPKLVNEAENSEEKDTKNESDQDSADIHSTIDEANV
ncbi:MAG: helix-turn-helix domain-containing protein [bacterium]